ncbi:MAG: DUF2961 domain-containing protein [Verrucomicrobia bacterium]|nr:DUF2961 domain-containing protein [Verrucomicrobiota bacterium]
MRTLWTVTLALTAATQFAQAADTLTYTDLIKRLTDLEALAALPAPGETCAQWSSYDRKSRYDDATGKYVAWDANGDGGGVIRKDGDKFVFAEMEGPGCIWRMWSARPQDGRVQIYLDGASEPAVDLPFLGYFDKKHEPFTRSALVHETAKGWNNYTPIPYQKSCKIVAEKGWGAYFQFVYATYPKGTQVPTFKRQLSAEENAALDEANKVLSAGGPATARTNDTPFRRDFVLQPGQPVRGNWKGPAAIRAMRCKVELPGLPKDREVLRELSLQIKWDGEEQPSVWAPLGDFFGTAAGANQHLSFPSGLTDDGWWYCNWFMPFAANAQITLLNDGAETRKVTFEILVTPLTNDLSRLARFHAKWHRDALLPAEPERAIDWTMLKTEGRGRFCGVMLHVWNPKGSWWGEGDEKFFVDGEKFPSTIGTGSEDYFGYAWCNPTLFQNAYHNQTISMGNKGHISVNRWHITDNVPFQKSFEGAIEKYFPNKRPTLYACTTYWYQAPDGKDPYPPLPITERVGYWAEPTNVVVKGALEGETMKVLSKSAGNPHEQAMDHYEAEWSNAAQLWWTGAKPGDRLELALPVAKAGRYQLALQLTKARDYGIVQLSLDGKKLGEPIDLFNPQVAHTGVLDRGIQELTAGEHKLGVEIIGANAKAMKSYMFGLDYVKLEPVL